MIIALVTWAAVHRCSTLLSYLGALACTWAKPLLWCAMTSLVTPRRQTYLAMVNNLLGCKKGYRSTDSSFAASALLTGSSASLSGLIPSAFSVLGSAWEMPAPLA